jgi:hypothetical protein
VSTNTKPAQNKPAPSKRRSLAVGPEKQLAAHATVIRQLGKRVIGDVIEIGRRLTECKDIAGHGNWLPWLDREFGWTDDTALNFIRVHELSKSRNFRDLNLPVSGLYLLAAPSTPETVREEIVERASKGEKLTVAQVKQINLAIRKEKLGAAVVARIANTSLGKSTEMKALVEVQGASPQQAQVLIQRAEAGESVSAVAALAALKQEPAPSNSQPPQKNISGTYKSTPMPAEAAEVLAAREAQACMQQDVGPGSAAEAERLRVDVEAQANEIQRLKKETIGLRSQNDELWDEMKAHLGAAADNAPLWMRLHHLLTAALAACERSSNWPPLNLDQEQRRNSAVQAMRTAMAELLDLASPAKHRLDDGGAPR